MGRSESGWSDGAKRALAVLESRFAMLKPNLYRLLLVLSSFDVNNQRLWLSGRWCTPLSLRTCKKQPAVAVAVSLVIFTTNYLLAYYQIRALMLIAQ